MSTAQVVFTVGVQGLFLVAILGGLILVALSLVSRLYPDEDLFASRKTPKFLIIAAGSLNAIVYAVIMVVLIRNDEFNLVTPLILLLPVVSALLPLGAASVRGFVATCGACAIMLAFFSFIAGFSVGALFPLSGAMLVMAGGVALARRG